ncbi:MAG: phospholipase A2 [Pseudobdellovibrio sp.]
MKYLIISFVVLLSFNLASANELLQNYCQQTGGQYINEWTCPNSKKVRDGGFCVQTNFQGKSLVFNGCTGAPSGYGERFFRACMIHDFCYHNEPAVSGKSKEECDSDLLNNMRKVCEQTGGSLGCRSAARAFYMAVSSGGNSSWQCEKNNAVYPDKLEQIP